MVTQFISLIFFVLYLFPFPAVGQIHQYHDLRYAEGDSVDHLLDLEVPESSDPLPLVVFVHGGGWRNGDKSNFITLLLGEKASDNPALAQTASPVTYIDPSDPPFLIMHGTEDKIVDISQSKILYDLLILNGVEATYIVIEGAGHGGREFSTEEKNATIVSFFDRHLKETSNCTHHENSPVSYDLKQNTPNPFNPTTSIHFYLPAREHISLKIYDILGKEICTLINEEYEHGNHTVQFDGRTLSGGLYIYRLSAEGQVFSNKMILMK